MTLTLAALLFAASASAQDRIIDTTGTGDTGTATETGTGTDTGTETGAAGDPTGGDPAGDPTSDPSGGPLNYEDYLQDLRDAAVLAPEPPEAHPVQIDIGMVGFLDARGVEIGKMFANGGNQHYHEEAFFHEGQAYDPAEPFGFRWLAAATPAGNLTPGFENRDYLDMDVWYTGIPDPFLTQNLIWSQYVERHTFLIIQQKEVRGWLLREVHTPPNADMTVFDHWAFLPSYDPPSALNESVRMVLAPEPFVTTAEYFNFLGGKPVDTYAQIEYGVLTGADSPY